MAPKGHQLQLFFVRILALFFFSAKQLNFPFPFARPNFETYDYVAGNVEAVIHVCSLASVYHICIVSNCVASEL